MVINSTNVYMKTICHLKPFITKETEKKTRHVLRKTDNAMAKWKGTKGQRMVDKTLHRKVNIGQHEPQ
jgi:hypothetical protein